MGASADLAALNGMLLRATPPIPAQEQQDSTRYAALQAWSLIKRHETALQAITDNLLAGKGLIDCLRAAEAAEALREAGVAAAKLPATEQPAGEVRRETPQEKAARERAEDAARGRKL